MSSKLDTLIHSMLLENTGSHFLDSGGAYGRNWQRNQGRTLEEYQNAPSATIEVRRYERDGKVSWDGSVCLSLFHHLRSALSLDPFCDEFNSFEVGNWDGEFHGTDQNQCAWLEDEEFEAIGDDFNSYNWCANFSQVVQGQHLEREGERYLLLQIHGGCDVRGGYTNAKLFKFECDPDFFLDESAGFSAEIDGEFTSLTWSCEWINDRGSCATDEDLTRVFSALGEGIHAGEQFEPV